MHTNDHIHCDYVTKSNSDNNNVLYTVSNKTRNVTFHYNFGKYEAILKIFTLGCNVLL